MSEPLFCRWLWHAATLLCDGTITCGLDDPFNLRGYGNIKDQSLSDILASEGVKQRRMDLLKGRKCHLCTLDTPVDPYNFSQLSPSTPYPYKLVVETSIRCNIRCNNTVCNVANDATAGIRSEPMLRWDVFTKTIDEVGDHLTDLFFFNYGEPFIHPKAPDMLAYARQKNPRMKITSSTNGILLAKKPLAERLVADQLVDWLCFTIGGSDEESYRRYHKAGSFAKAIEGMSNIAEAKQRLGFKKPVIHWRYLLFKWNDTDRHIEEALRLAREIGVDEFKIFITGTPIDGRSLRRAPDTPGFHAIKEWLDYDHHYHVDPYAEAGLWTPEEHPHLGRLAWTGRDARLLLFPEDNRINIRLARPDMPGVPETQAQVSLPWGTFDADIGIGGWADNEFSFPSTHPAYGEPVRAELRLSSTFSPFRHGQSIDGRELGVMLDLAGIEPHPNLYRPNVVREVGPRLRQGA